MEYKKNKVDCEVESQTGTLSGKNKCKNYLVKKNPAFC